MKKFLLLSLLILSPNLALAADGANTWLGAFYGQQSTTGLKPMSYGLDLGLKKGRIGGEIFYITGTKTVSTSVATITADESITQFGGRLDLFLIKRFFYLGPQIVNAKVKATVSALGVTVTAENSGMLYGGGGGINIPIGRISFGADGSYVTGKINSTSAHLTTVVGSVKVWF